MFAKSEKKKSSFEYIKIKQTEINPEDVKEERETNMEVEKYITDFTRLFVVLLKICIMKSYIREVKFK